MQKINKTLRTLGLAISVTAVLAACSTPAPKQSGFLSDYSQLRKVSAPGGGTRLAYLNPNFTPDRYQAVWLDRVVFYPQPQPTQDVSAQTLEQIRANVEQALRQKIGEQVRLADHAGAGVARVSVAITAVGAETESLKAYQYIPVALVLTGAKAAIEGGRPREASIAIETRVVDSVTNELLYAAVRGGTGEQVANAAQGQAGVQPSSLQPLIDEWTTGAAGEIRKYVRAK